MDNDSLDPTKIIKELVNLAQRHPLKGVELSRAKGLMRTLKQSGYTNKEILSLPVIPGVNLPSSFIQGTRQ